MQTLIIIGCIILYIAAGFIIGEYMRVKYNFGEWWDRPFTFFSTIFWPVAILFIISIPFIRYLLMFGSYLATTEKRITQQKTRVIIKEISNDAIQEAAEKEIEEILNYKSMS
jgi:hypothetical protein